MRRHPWKRWLIGSMLVTSWMLSAGLTLAKAQAPRNLVGPLPREVRGFKEAPGYYGMSYGVPSYGSVRTYSEFSSPYGGGYGYGYRPAAILPGTHGAGIWRPGSNPNNYGYRADSYRTFAVPYQANPPHPVVTPPVGVYAPAFGPSPGYARVGRGR